MKSSSGTLRSRTLALMAVLVAANVLAWIWAVAVFHDHATLMGMSLLAWTYGLRHAVDADHIAAIDNVTRKLMQQGQRPIGVGAFFSLGHSTIVVLASCGIALLTSRFTSHWEWFHNVGGVIGTSVSALFLLVLAVVNLMILRDVWSRFRAVERGQSAAEVEVDAILPGGLMTRIYHRLFALVGHSWQMYLVGFLFGLGFDTATEVGLLGISAAGSSSGLPVWSILVFPLLFTSGMALIDSLDNLVMVQAYGWAFDRPLRKLYYNLTITGTSVIVAFVIGGFEALGLLADRLGAQGGFWQLTGSVNDHLGNAGFVVIGIMIACWGLSWLNYQWRGYDRVAA